MNICKKCKLSKPLNEFNINSKGIVRNRCKVCVSEDNLAYKTKNKKALSDKQKLSYIDNSEYYREKSRLYRLNNKDKIRISRNKYFTDRQKVDKVFYLACSIRKLICVSFKSKSLNKKQKTEDILGCSFIEFKLYLESKFKPWMTWENKGLYNGKFDYGWDADHIVPISSAKTEDDIIRLNHYTNFQPLCSKVNRDIKRNKEN